jgi:hypothetical protein
MEHGRAGGFRVNTPQDILDREGFMPVSTSYPCQIGQIVETKNPTSIVPLGCKLKIVGILTAEEFYALGAKYHPGRGLGSGPYFYKAIIE